MGPAAAGAVALALLVPATGMLLAFVVGRAAYRRMVRARSAEQST